MTPEQIQELLDTLFEIGGAVASKGWELALRQVYASIAVNIFWLIVLLVVAVASAKMAAAGSERKEETYYGGKKELTEAGIWMMAGGISMAIGAVLIAALVATYIIQASINPEWYAAKLLLGLVN